MTEKEEKEALRLGAAPANQLKPELSEYLGQEIDDKTLRVIAIAIGLFVQRVTDY